MAFHFHDPAADALHAGHTSHEINRLAEHAFSGGPSAVREFIVDVLGSLVPGITFLIACVPAFLLPLALLLDALFQEPLLLKPGALLSRVFSVDPSASMTAVLFLVVPATLAFLTFAYVFGHLFYRQSPNVPDQRSYEVVNRSEESRVSNLARESSGVKIEYPYADLREFLEERGFTYLSGLVPWAPGEPSGSSVKRSKHFANALKLRIQIESPRAYQIIAKNEAHVRLSSSMWYVTHALQRIVALTLAMVALGSVVLFVRTAPSLGRPGFWWSFGGHVFLIALSPLVAWIVARETRLRIERFFHYQRRREILFILEIAYWLSRHIKNPVAGLFVGLERADEV